MPIKYHIDHERRLVFAKAMGTLAGLELFDYQREVWSRPDVVGYHELVDMTAVVSIESPTAQGMRDLASLSATTDAPVSSVGDAGRFAIVAPQHLAFGLGRMYEAYRGLQPNSTKQVGVFRTLKEAASFLGLASLPAE